MTYLEYKIRAVPRGFQKLFYLNWPIILLLCLFLIDISFVFPCSKCINYFNNNNCIYIVLGETIAYLDTLASFTII